MHVLSSELIRKVDRYTDEHHGTFTTLGRDLFRQFGSDRGKSSTQVRNLQQIVCSATRFADIEDFVKNQMGKGDKNWRALGEDVLQQLGQLRDHSRTLADDSEDQLTVRLRLARGWVRTVVGEYLYQLALKEMGDRT